MKNLNINEVSEIIDKVIGGVFIIIVTVCFIIFVASIIVYVIFGHDILPYLERLISVVCLTTFGSLSFLGLKNIIIKIINREF